MVEYVQSACSWIASLPWRSIFVPLAAPLAALYVAIKFGHIQAEIGRRQAKTAALAMETARHKLRLDLFEKRFTVYEVVNSYIEHVGGNRNGTESDVFALIRGTKTAIWLFDEKTANYITKQIHRDALILDNVLENLGLDPDEDDKRELLKKRKEVRKRFDEHREVLHELMAPYLRFTEDVKT